MRMNAAQRLTSVERVTQHRAANLVPNAVLMLQGISVLLLLRSAVAVLVTLVIRKMERAAVGSIVVRVRRNA